MTDSIIQWIPNPVIGKQSSSEFDVLIGDDPLCLNKQCFATVSVKKNKTSSFLKIHSRPDSIIFCSFYINKNSWHTLCPNCFTIFMLPTKKVIFTRYLSEGTYT